MSRKRRARQDARARKARAAKGAASINVPLLATIPPQQESRGLPQQVTSQSKFLKWWRKPLPKWWLLGLGILAVAQALYNFRPRIDIEPASALDERDPSSTLFRITNLGPWTLHGIEFTCQLFNGSFGMSVSHMTVMRDNIPIFGEVTDLPPNEPTTQECAVSGSSGPLRIPIPDPKVVTMNFTVEYDFPFLPFKRSIPTTRHFAVRPSPDGKKFLLVPQIPTSPR
jgi:hypothetical protein